MQQKKIVIKNPAGIYLGLAGNICKAAMDYKSKLTIKHNNITVNVKSILNLLGSNIKCGDEIELISEGIDEEKAISVISEILEKELV